MTIHIHSKPIIIYLMDLRIFHGNLSPQNLASALLGEFNRGNLRAQSLGSAEKLLVQIATRDMPASGGETALTVTLEKVDDGVAVGIGKQAWLGVAASLGKTALAAWRNPWRNPWRILERLDDLAQDIENIQLSDHVWRTIELTASQLGATFELSERLRRVVCAYCLTANPVGEPSCIACGAPLGLVQPGTCSNCGYIITREDTSCPNCGFPL